MLDTNEIKETNVQLVSLNPHVVEVVADVCLDLSRKGDGGCGFKGHLINEIRKFISGEDEHSDHLTKLEPYHVTRLEFSQLCQSDEVPEDYPKDINLSNCYGSTDNGEGVIEFRGEPHPNDNPSPKDIMSGLIKGVYSRSTGDILIFFKNDKLDADYHEYVRVKATINLGASLDLDEGADPLLAFVNAMDDIVD